MNSNTNRRLEIAVAAIGILAAHPAMAVLPTDWNGATIGFQYLYPNDSAVVDDDGSLLVGPGAEGDFFGYFTYDISANQIVLNAFAEGNWDNSSFNGPRFYDYGLDDVDLTGVSVNPASNMAGLSNANLTWDGDNIYVNWQGLLFNPETQVILDLQFNGEQSVPEASTWAAGGTLAAVVGGMWLRRRRA
jgi:hypothetical protein